METRSLATVLVALLNTVGTAVSEAAGEIEKLISADGDDTGGDEKPTRRARKSKDEEKPTRSRPSRAKAKSKDEDEDDDDADDEDGEEEEEEEEDDDSDPTEDDVIDAVRAAQKVLPRDEVVKLVKKFGKAERSRDVKPENRRHLIVNLEKAVKNAEED